MKILTEKEIEEMAVIRGTHGVHCTCKGKYRNSDEIKGFKEGYHKAQQDLLASASEGFEEWLVGYFALEGSNDLIEDVNTQNIEYAELVEAWQTCSIAHTKKMQEKDKEIEALTKEKDAWKTMYSELKSRVVGA